MHPSSPTVLDDENMLYPLPVTILPVGCLPLLLLYLEGREEGRKEDRGEGRKEGKKEGCQKEGRKMMRKDDTKEGRKDDEGRRRKVKKG
jgi:hypothetical protein